MVNTDIDFESRNSDNIMIEDLIEKVDPNYLSDYAKLAAIVRAKRDK